MKLFHILYRKPFAVIITFYLITLISCRRDEDNINIPAQNRNLIYQKYPSSEILEMKVLEEGKVYQFGFIFQKKYHQSIVTNSSILNTTRISDEQIPDKLRFGLDTLAIKGGKLSNQRTVESYYTDTPITEQIFDYHLNGKSYILLLDDYRISLRPYEHTSYKTRSIEDLPEKIQQYINSRQRPNPVFVNSLTNLNEQSKQYIINNNELRFVECRVNILSGGLKNYEVMVNFLGITNLTMLFNDKGDLISVPQFNRIRQFNQNFDKLTSVSNLKTDEISFFRDLFSGQSEMFGFNLDGQKNFQNSFRSEFENTKSYQFVLYNYRGENWSLHYDESKSLVNFYYSSR